MHPKKLFLPVGIFTLMPSLWFPAQAAPETLISLSFPPTVNRGAPARTAGGGTRGTTACVEPGSVSLTGVMPSNNVGTTVAANPTLFVYVPKTSATAAEFYLMDSSGNELNVKTVEVSGTSSIVKISIPETTLEVGKVYQWQFSLICDPGDRSADVSVKGNLERSEISQTLKTRLEKASPLEQAKLYAEASIWNETIATLAQLRSSNPTEWEELLKSVGLEAIANVPFAPTAQ